MTALERVLAVFQGGQPDMLPVLPIIGQAAARLNQLTFSAELKSPEILAESRIACLKRFGYDGLYISAETWVAAEAMGAPVAYFDDAPVQGVTPLLAEKAHIAQLRPADPARDGRLPLLVQAVAIAARRSRDQFAVIGNFDQSPFSLACALRGINHLLTDIYDDPAFAQQLLEICTVSVIRYAKAMGAAGAHLLNTGDSPAMLIGPEHYARFALPYEQMVFAELQPCGLPTTLHVCGNTTQLLGLLGKSQAHGLELDYPVDLAAARKNLPAETVLIGNLDPVGSLWRASPATVAVSVQTLLAAAGQCGRFIFSTGCAVAPETPPENIHAMVQTARNYGQNPRNQVS